MGEGVGDQTSPWGHPDLRDRTLMREIQFLGALIADVEGRTDHLSPDEVDQALQRAEAAIHPGTPTEGKQAF